MRQRRHLQGDFVPAEQSDPIADSVDKEMNLDEIGGTIPGQSLEAQPQGTHSSIAMPAQIHKSESQETFHLLEWRNRYPSTT